MNVQMCITFTSSSSCLQLVAAIATEESIEVDNKRFAFFILGLKPGWVIQIIQVIFCLGQLGHVLPRSSRSDLVYKISGPDPDSALDHVH